MSDEIIQPTSSSKSVFKWVAIGVAVIIVLLISGYLAQRFTIKKVPASTEKTAQKTIVPTPSVPADSVNSTAMIRSNTWPDDMPSEVLKFTAGNLQQAMKPVYKERKLWVVTISKVGQSDIDAYIKQAESKGWKIVDSSIPSPGIYGMEKGQIQLQLAFFPSANVLTLSVQEVNPALLKK